jgi:hypothetical protein
MKTGKIRLVDMKPLDRAVFASINFFGFPLSVPTTYFWLRTAIHWTNVPDE